MPFVLDASVVITWVMSDEHHPMADLAFQKIQTDSAVVPAIWWYEVRNTLIVNERRGRISSNDSARFLSDLLGFDIEVRPPENSHGTIDLARKYNLSIYDAAYLALASEQNLPIATLDEALRVAARAVGAPLLS